MNNSDSDRDRAKRIMAIYEKDGIEKKEAIKHLLTMLSILMKDLGAVNAGMENGDTKIYLTITSKEPK